MKVLLGVGYEEAFGAKNHPEYRSYLGYFWNFDLFIEKQFKRYLLAISQNTPVDLTGRSRIGDSIHCGGRGELTLNGRVFCQVHQCF